MFCHKLFLILLTLRQDNCRTKSTPQSPINKLLLVALLFHYSDSLSVKLENFINTKLSFTF